MTNKQRGRRPGETQTRQAIVAAARRMFAADGYQATSLRSIAREAGVDPALVLHFYAGKEELFAVAVHWPFEPAAAVQRILDGPRAAVGRRMAEFFFSIWEHPEDREPIMGMLRAATTSEHAAALLREFVAEQILAPVAVGLGVDDAELRMSLCASQVIGLGIARYVVRLEPLAGAAAEDLLPVVAPVFQRYMTGRLA